MNIRLNISVLLLFTFLIVSCNKTSDSVKEESLKSEIELPQYKKDSIQGVKWLKRFHGSINEYELKELDFTVYRFNFLDAFGKHKIFRLEHYSETHNRLFVKYVESDENSKKENYKLKSESNIQLSEEQFKEFKMLIEGSYFWSMQMVEKNGSVYLDGYSYLMEGFQPETRYKPKRFHIVFRVVPHEGSFSQACEKLMEFHEQSKTEK